MTIAQRTYSPLWQRLTIAVIGGDEREQEICRLAAESGALVKAFGFPWPASGVGGVVLAPDAAQALAGAHIALMPIPGIAMDGSLFATTKIIPREPLLREMAAGAHIILGRADAGLKEAAAALGIAVHEYEGDQELMLLRAPAIVEGVVRALIEHTQITLHGARIGVIGQGNIGTVLTRTLIAVGAQVTVAARNPIQRAAAYTLGAVSVSVETLPQVAGSWDIVISTAPAQIVTASLIDRLPLHALVVDVTAPPGSCDLEHATATGRKAIWGRALGRRAPITVGGSQWHGIARIIEGILSEDPRHAG